MRDTASGPGSFGDPQTETPISARSRGHTAVCNTATVSTDQLNSLTMGCGGGFISSFRPEDVQPSGSINASRLNTMTLQLELNTTVTPSRGTANARIYALNHNILRIVDGFGGILFRV